MNLTTYTKIVNSKDYNDTSMSLGFRRYWCLPSENRKNLSLAHMVQNNTKDGGIKEINQFFEKMTETEYKQYVITH